MPAATPTIAALPSPETLLRARGAPSTVYAILNGSIQSIQLDDDQTTADVLPPPEGARFVAIDSSPSGDRVAAVTVADDGSTDPPPADLFVFDRAGTVVETWPDVIAPEPIASTPVPDTPGGPADEMDLMVDWSAQGDRIIVASPGGRIVIAAFGGDTTALNTPAEVASIRGIEWSPRGDTIALLAIDEDNVGRIGLIDPAAANPEFLPVAPVENGGEGGSVRSFAWLPDGSGLVYLGGEDGGGQAVGGQLFSVDLETMAQRLVATAGQGGPSATIADFSVSPDGKAVAYTIVVPDGGIWRFNSLWVRSLRDQRALRMPVGDVIEVNAVWWVDRGLLWGQAISDGERIQESFIRLAPGGDPTVILTVDVGGRAGEQGGTPEAVPEASPASATPVG